MNDRVLWVGEEIPICESSTSRLAEKSDTLGILEKIVSSDKNVLHWKGKYPSKSCDIVLHPFESGSDIRQPDILVPSRISRKAKDIDAVTRQ